MSKIQWQQIEHLLNDHTVDLSLDEIRDHYQEDHRYYHTLDHIEDVLEANRLEEDSLILALLFHDIKFSGRHMNYRELSSRYFRSVCHGDPDFVDEVCDLIEGKGPQDLQEEFDRVNTLILRTHDINSLLNWENAIFKEYQHHSVNTYKKRRITFLNKAYQETSNEILLELRDIIAERVYKIGFYPGSFNPFHIGHYNILEKSEKYFDKVVIGVGVNYEKRELAKSEIPGIIKNRQIVYYSGLITTEIQQLKEHGEVFVVRGLRNAYDLQHEEGLRNVIKDFFPDQEFVYYFCDKEYEHISSSLIRDIQSRGKDNVMSDNMLKRYTFPVDIKEEI